MRFKINHNPRPKEITHWDNFMGNETRKIKELGSCNKEKKKRMKNPKNWDPKTHEGIGFKIHEAKERPSWPRLVSQKKPNREN